MQREMFRSKLGAPPPKVQQGAPAAADVVSAGTEDEWRPYFDERLSVRVDGAKAATFRVLSAGPHDGGALRTTFLMLHGAGHSAMTFALAAQAMKRSARVVAFDMRGHGETTADDEGDLSVETLIADAIAVANSPLTDIRTPIVLVGHSMGGAIAVRVATATAPSPQLQQQLTGVAVLDVVEGTAMAALPSMMSVLASKPPAFPDIQHAIAWNIGSGSGTRNMESARISIPSQLCRAAGDQLVWRTDLRGSERFWRGWFEGLSELFLRIRAARLLILAGTDRLDKPLTIGQMQGKFQLKLMPNCGHLIQEDEPAETAAIFLAFAQRYAQPVVKLPAKLSVAH